MADDVNPLSHHSGVDIAFAPYQLECEEELKRHPELTYTLIRNGLFLDYLAMPYGPMPTNLKPLWLFLDLPHQRLVIPGDGTDHVVFTHTADLAACIERLVALPAEQWPREALLQGNRIQVKDLVEITRRISGECPPASFSFLSSPSLPPLPSSGRSTAMAFVKVSDVSDFFFFFGFFGCRARVCGIVGSKGRHLRRQTHGAAVQRSRLCAAVLGPALSRARTGSLAHHFGRRLRELAGPGSR